MNFTVRLLRTDLLACPWDALCLICFFKTWLAWHSPWQRFIDSCLLQEACRFTDLLVPGIHVLKPASLNVLCTARPLAGFYSVLLVTVSLLCTDLLVHGMCVFRLLLVSNCLQAVAAVVTVLGRRYRACVLRAVAAVVTVLENGSCTCWKRYRARVLRAVAAVV
jgi:hypothetical protein